MLTSTLVGLLCVVCLHHVAEAGLQLMGTDGLFRANHQLNRFVPPTTDHVLNVLDCTFDNKCEFLNENLGTSFNNEKGLSVDVVGGAAVQYSSSDIFTPAQVSMLVDYYVSLSGKLVLLFDATQIESTLDGHDRILRKLVSLSKIRSEKNQRTEISIICVGQSTDPAYAEDVITKRFEMLWKEIEPTKVGLAVPSLCDV